MVPVNSAPTRFPPLPTALRWLWGGGIFCCHHWQNWLWSGSLRNARSLACRVPDVLRFVGWFPARFQRFSLSARRHVATLLPVFPLAVVE
nr:MAG TPA: hypothetical protein [Caudoviricetes sp.]